jgi:hypothetical protein
MYAQGVVASTHPNRGMQFCGILRHFRDTHALAAFWASGSINVPGGPQNLDQGGVMIDNNGIPGCEAPNLDCFPLKWKTYAEFMEDANVTWQVVRVLLFLSGCWIHPLQKFIVSRSSYQFATYNSIVLTITFAGTDNFDDNP